jgi:hypothetical protein
MDNKKAIELYNRAVSAYRAEATQNSRFVEVINLPASDRLMWERIDEEENAIADSDDQNTRVRLSLARMFGLGLEIGYRLGQAEAAQVPAALVN